MKDMELSLDTYLANARSALAKFEAKLGWKPPDVEESKEALVPCPYNDGHNMLPARLEAHTGKCEWRQQGYTFEEIDDILGQEEMTKSQNNRYANTDDIIRRIAPEAGKLRTSERYASALDSSQRLAVYEAEVAELYSSDKKIPDNALFVDLTAKAAERMYEKENPENLSEFELKKKLRDMKRRRQSYRAKNVHITKRSQTEIIRGVLEVHMEELAKLWNPKQDPGHVGDEETTKPAKTFQSTDRRFDKETIRDAKHIREGNYSREREVRRYSWREDRRKDVSRRSARESDRRSHYSPSRPHYSPSRKRTKQSENQDRRPRRENTQDTRSVDNIIHAIRERNTYARNMDKHSNPSHSTLPSETKICKDEIIPHGNQGPVLDRGGGTSGAQVKVSSALGDNIRSLRQTDAGRSASKERRLSKSREKESHKKKKRKKEKKSKKKSRHSSGE